MQSSRRLLVGSGVILAALAIGAGVVIAGGADDDRPLRGAAYERASEAALEYVGEGSVIETEVGDDGAAYGVEVRKADGTVLEVNLDSDFEVIGAESDDDGPGDEEHGGSDDSP